MDQTSIGMEKSQATFTANNHVLNENPDEITRYFLIKTVQVIVQSRLGLNKDIIIEGKPLDGDRFNSNITDIKEVNEQVTKVLDKLCHPGFTIKRDWRLCCEIFARTNDGSNKLLELWIITNRSKLDGNENVPLLLEHSSDSFVNNVSNHDTKNSQLNTSFDVDANDQNSNLQVNNGFTNEGTVQNGTKLSPNEQHSLPIACTPPLDSIPSLLLENNGNIKYKTDNNDDEFELSNIKTSKPSTSLSLVPDIVSGSIVAASDTNSPTGDHNQTSLPSKSNQSSPKTSIMHSMYKEMSLTLESLKTSTRVSHAFQPASYGLLKDSDVVSYKIFACSLSESNDVLKQENGHMDSRTLEKLPTTVEIDIKDFVDDSELKQFSSFTKLESVGSDLNELDISFCCRTSMNDTKEDSPENLINHQSLQKDQPHEDFTSGVELPILANDCQTDNRKFTDVDKNSICSTEKIDSSLKDSDRPSSVKDIKVKRCRHGKIIVVNKDKSKKKDNHQIKDQEVVIDHHTENNSKVLKKEKKKKHHRRSRSRDRSKDRDRSRDRDRAIRDRSRPKSRSHSRSRGRNKYKSPETSRQRSRSHMRKGHHKAKSRSRSPRVRTGRHRRRSRSISPRDTHRESAYDRRYRKDSNHRINDFYVGDDVYDKHRKTKKSQDYVPRFLPKYGESSTAEMDLPRNKPAIVTNQTEKFTQAKQNESKNNPMPLYNDTIEKTRGPDSVQSLPTPIQDELNAAGQHGYQSLDTQYSDSSFRSNSDIYDPEEPLGPISPSDSPIQSPTNQSANLGSMKATTLMEQLRSIQNKQDGNNTSNVSMLDTMTNLLNSLVETNPNFLETMQKLTGSTLNKDDSGLRKGTNTMLNKLGGQFSNQPSSSQRSGGVARPQSPSTPPRHHRIDIDVSRPDDGVPSSAVDLNNKEKYIQKLNRQERVIEEVKLALKPHYQKRAVTKEEYKDILRRAVPKICHSKNGEINAVKIRSMVDAYIKKAKHARKK